MKFKTLLSKKRNIDSYFLGLLGLLFALIFAFSLINAQAFLSFDNFQAMVYQFPEFGLMAFGVMFTMIAGGIDLSSVGIANLSSIMAATVLITVSPKGVSEGRALLGVVLALLVGIVTGALAGYFNGLLVSKVKIPAMLATLGTLQLFTGLGLVITKGSAISRLPSSFSNLGRSLIFGEIPLAMFIFVAVVIILSLVMSKLRFGTELYMVGSNPVAARFSGLNVHRITTKAYTYSGMLSGLAGMIMLANYNSAKPDYGSSYTLQTILIVVLGGVSPAGGFGSPGGVCLAILILQISSSGLNLFPSISNFYRQLIWGGVLLLVLTIKYFNGKVIKKRISKSAIKLSNNKA